MDFVGVFLDHSFCKQVFACSSHKCTFNRFLGCCLVTFSESCWWDTYLLLSKVPSALIFVLRFFSNQTYITPVPVIHFHGSFLTYIIQCNVHMKSEWPEFKIPEFLRCLTNSFIGWIFASWCTKKQSQCDCTKDFLGKWRPQVPRFQILTRDSNMSPKFSLQDT
jgi:hypothetical protein